MSFTRVFVSRFIVAAVLCLGIFSSAQVAQAQSVEVRGSQRVDAETIRNYFAGTDPARVNQAVKELYATGLFSSVRTERSGGKIIVYVSENQMINRVAFEGNSKIKSTQLEGEVQSKSRGAYNPSTVQADIERISDLYRRGGRGDATVTARTVDLPNGRLDVVFTVNEGSKTGVRSINFVGNQAYSTYRLRNLMTTTEMNWLSFFKSTDVYDPDRIASDEELIRRFYLKNGYADFRIVGSDARYDAQEKGYVITVTVDEGRQYHVGSINVESSLPDVDAATLRKSVKISQGAIYNGDLVDKSADAITREVARHGYAFSSARPRGDRDPATGLIALSFVVEEGPRVYIERIDIHGNTRTRDYVIRREFPIGEGDAYNRALMDKAEKRLNSLGFFKSVRITNEPGSAPDRVIINVQVEDQPTGSFSISGGYSTTDGVIAEVAVSESNFLGRGQYARLSVTGGLRTRGVEFNFTEPYFMDYRLAAGFDLFARQSKNNQYAIYDSTSAGITLRLGVPLTDEFSFAPRYSFYGTKITVPNDPDRPYNDCTLPNGLPTDTPSRGGGVIDGITPGTPSYTNPLSGNTGVNSIDAVYNCLSNGEASLAIKDAGAQGWRLVSMAGYSLIYNTLDNAKNPTEGIYAEFRQDVAGLGGDAKFLRTTGELRYYYPLFQDIVGFVKLQAGDITAFGGDKLSFADNFNLGPALVRGFAPGGIGPRDLSNPFLPKGNGIGGSKYVGASLEFQFPIWGMPKDLGLKGAVFADAGTLFGYEGKTNFGDLYGLPPNSPCVAPATAVYPGTTALVPVTQGTCLNVDDSKKIRSSVGASILWASPLGPIRFDYAFVLSKDRNDVGQAFRFSGGGSF